MYSFRKHPNNRVTCAVQTDENGKIIAATGPFDMGEADPATIETLEYVADVEDMIWVARHMEVYVPS